MNTSLIYGKHAVYEALQAAKKLEKILLLRNSSSHDLSVIETLARQQQIPVQKVPVQKLNSLTTKNHQGVVAFLAVIPYYQLDDILAKVYDEGRMPLFLVLDHITDVRNLGAIARTALGAGVDALVLPAYGSALISSDAIKTSSGALLHIHVCKVKKLAEAISFFRNNGIRIVAADKHCPKYVFQEDLTGPLALVVGAEDKGISLPVLQTADMLVKIPINPALESYNVSVAAGMLLYEAMRQRELASR